MKLQVFKLKTRSVVHKWQTMTQKSLKSFSNHDQNHKIKIQPLKIITNSLCKSLRFLFSLRVKLLKRQQNAMKSSVDWNWFIFQTFNVSIFLNILINFICDFAFSSILLCVFLMSLIVQWESVLNSREICNFWRNSVAKTSNNP